jgi:imidazolonepropionase-like amidohydrolase
VSDVHDRAMVRKGVRRLLALVAAFGTSAPASSGLQTETAPAPQAAAPEAPAAARELDPPDAGAHHAYESDALRRPSLTTGGDLLIQGAMVHSAVEPARVADVLVQQGRIVALGVGLAAPDGVRIFDGRGRHLAPGAVDAHSHMAIGGGVNEGTESITAETDLTDVVDPTDLGLYRALAGGTTTMQILHGSANAIGGRSELLKLRWDPRQTADELRLEHGPQGIKFALGENPKRSNGFRDASRFPATRLGVEAVYYRAFERAREYRAEWERYRTRAAAGEDPPPPRRDERLEALVAVLDGRLVVHSHSYRADEILMLLRAAEHFGFRIGTLHHVLEGYKVAAEIAAHGAGTSTFSDWWAYKLEAYDAIPGNAALLHEAGVLSGIKSDSDELVRHLYHEAAKSVGYAGLDPLTALQLVTLNPARQLGVAERLGSIEVGKDADLVLFDGDPLSVYSRVLWTLVDGEFEFERRDTFGFDGAPLAARAEQPRPEAPALALAADGGPLLVIRGATLHPVEGPPLADGTLVVQDGRIVGLAAGTLEHHWPDDTRFVDAPGAHLWPGVIALHTTLGLREIDSVRASVDTSEIGGDQPDLRVAASLHPDSAHIEVNRSRGVTRAQSLPLGRGPLSGQSALIRLEGETWEELLYVDRDMLHVRFPGLANDAAERDKRREGEGSRALRELFAAAGHYAAAREAAAETGAAGPPHDPRLAALAPFARGAGRVALHADNAQTLLNALRFAEALDLDAVLYGAAEAWKVADRIAEVGLPVVLGPVLALPQDPSDPYDAPYANAAVLYRAGVPFAIGAGNDDNPRNLIFHAGFAAAFGLPREEALRAITLSAAELAGVGEELGSLAVGKWADLVLTDGDLLEPTTRVLGLWIEGVETSLESRHTQLYERYRQRLRDARER